MTRLQQELNGSMGDYWKGDAERRIAKAKEEFETEMTTDADGVVRNRIGRVLMSDMVELIEAAGCKFNKEATRIARQEEDSKDIAQYRESMKNYKPSEEELYEMRAAFGEGAEVVDVITGKKIKL